MCIRPCFASYGCGGESQLMTAMHDGDDSDVGSSDGSDSVAGNGNVNFGGGSGGAESAGAGECGDAGGTET